MTTPGELPQHRAGTTRGAAGRGWRRLAVDDQLGRRVIVTGANTGIGLATAQELAAAGAQVVMAVRDLDRGQAAAQRIRAEVPQARLRVLHLDLANLSSVHEFATALVSDGPVDVLINNAGVMLVPHRKVTVDGFERHMGVNHLGHFALTAWLWPAITAGDSPRVVSVTSLTYRSARSLDHRLGEPPASGVDDYVPMRAYAQSKLAVALFAEELQRRASAAGLPVRSVLAHPGWSATAERQPTDRAGRRVVFARRATALLGSSPAHGAAPVVRAATAASLVGGELVGPRFLVRGSPAAGPPPGRAMDPVEGAWLWGESVRLTGADPGLGPAASAPPG